MNVNADGWRYLSNCGPTVKDGYYCRDHAEGFRAGWLTIEQERPASKQARTLWQNQIVQAKARLAQLERRFERVGEIAHDASLYADSMLDELAARKLRFHHPDLARQWDAIQQQQRIAALRKLQSAQSVKLDLGRTRFLSFSSEC